MGWLAQCDRCKRTEPVDMLPKDRLVPNDGENYPLPGWISQFDIDYLRHQFVCSGCVAEVRGEHVP